MKVTASNINFNAQYLDKVNVKKKSFLRYKPYEVSLVEFDRKNEDDAKALHKIVDECGSRAPIFTLFWTHGASNEHIVGLTTQKNNFEKPDSDKILGVMHYYNFIECDYIDKLQVKPKYQNNKSFKLNKNYKNIGKAFIEKLREINGNKRLELTSLPNAIPFYEKLGFQHKSERKPQLMYLD